MKSIQHAIDSNDKVQKEWKKLYKIGDEHVGKWEDIFVSNTISPSVTWAVRQTEETFCDIVGLRIFGEAFLHAFAYLLSPGEESRLADYPSMVTRVKYLLQAAEFFELTIPLEYADLYRSDPAPSLVSDSAQGEFQLELADGALASVVTALITEVDSEVERRGIAKPDTTKIANIRKRFNLTVSGERSGGLANILNAGWQAYLDASLWASYRHIPENIRKNRLLDLVLKNVEILDLEQKKEAS